MWSKKEPKAANPVQLMNKYADKKYLDNIIKG